MKFTNVIYALYCEPWYIDPVMHERLCIMLDQHVTGAAHLEGGIAQVWGNEIGPAPIGTSVLPDAEEEMKLGIIEMHGVIGMRVGGLARCSGALDILDVDAAFKQLENDDSVQGILLSIDSPGGTVGGVPEMAERVAACEKPVVAFTDHTMCSAAYYIAAGADIIVATQSSCIGSIGTYMALLDRSKEFEKLGRKVELFKSGKFKAAGLEGVPLTAEQKKNFQSQVDQHFAIFKEFVSEYRNVGKTVFQGQAFWADVALGEGLIDLLGDKDDALCELREMVEANKKDDDECPT